MGPLPVRRRRHHLLADSERDLERSWSPTCRSRCAWSAARICPTSLLASVRGQVLVVEDLPDLIARDLATLDIRLVLHDRAELDLQLARQVERVVGLEQVGDAPLARLRVDAHDGLVSAAQVLRVDGQVGHGPQQVVDRDALGLRLGLHRLETLLDRILVRSAERRVDEVARPRAALPGTGSWLQYSAVRLTSSRSLKSICGSMPCVNRLMPRATRSTLPVRSPLPKRHPSMRSRTGQVAELGRCHRGAAVVVRMQRQDDVLARDWRRRDIHSIESA